MEYHRALIHTKNEFKQNKIQNTKISQVKENDTGTGIERS